MGDTDPVFADHRTLFPRYRRIGCAVSRTYIPNSDVLSLAHLLDAAFEVLRFELPVFVIRLGEMVGIDKRIAAHETAKCLFPAWDSNRIVSDPPS